MWWRENSSGQWICPDCLEFTNNILLGMEHDMPFNYLVRQVFIQVVGKFLTYSGCRKGVHMLMRLNNEDELEMHSLQVDLGDDRTRKALHWLEKIRGQPEPDENSDMVLEYGSVRISSNDPGFVELLKAAEQLVSDYPPSEILARDGAIFEDVLEISDSEGDKKVLAVPLGSAVKGFPLGWTGAVILWEGAARFESLGCRFREEVRKATKILDQFCDRIFRLFGASEGDYLGTFKLQEREARVGILFADIRNYTPTTEMCRNYHLTPEWTRFMKDFHALMGKIVLDHGGYVHQTTGDGLIALFRSGSLNSDELRVTASIKTAERMVEEFSYIREKFLESPKLEKFHREATETLDFSLGIGINYGPVMFDYFGVKGHRKYAPLGDHMNFTQRLESFASRFDEGSRKKIGPILLSQPAWYAIDKPGRERCSKLTLRMKGKPLEYLVYEWILDDVEQ